MGDWSEVVTVVASFLGASWLMTRQTNKRVDDTKDGVEKTVDRLRDEIKTWRSEVRDDIRELRSDVKAVRSKYSCGFPTFDVGVDPGNV